MRHSRAFRLVLILGFTTSVLIGCSRDPNVRKQKYFESGQRYFEKAKYREAAIQFSNAVQVDPRFVQAPYHLAQTYLKLQEWTRAYQELSRAIEIDPDNYQARIDLANLLIAGRDFKQAQDQTDFLMAKQPNNPEGHIAVANLDAARDNLVAALQEMQKAAELGPDRWETYLNFALLQIRANQSDAAEANFKKAVSLNPKAISAQLALGSYYQSRSRFPEAEQQFRHAMEADPKDPDSRAALVRVYMAEGKKAEIEEFLKEVKRDLPDKSVGYRMLGDYYFASGDLDKAVTEYGSLNQEHPKDIQVKKNYIQLLILKNRIAEARKLDDEVLKTSPSDTEALIFKGEIQIADGHGNDAAESLQSALKADPNNGVAHYQLGVAFDQMGNLGRAENEWREAGRVRPDLPDVQHALAAVALRKGDMQALDQSADQLIRLQPTVADGYVLRAMAEINLNRLAQAETDIRKAMEVAPQNPIGYNQMGRLRLTQKQYSQAEKYFRQALERDPASTDGLNGLMNVYLAQKQTDLAITAANAQLAKVPDSSAFHDLLGTTLFNDKKDMKGAEAEFKRAAELDKNNSDALVKLGQVQAAEGSADQAIATYQQSLNNNPREVRFYILIGELFESKRDREKAKQMYQKALEIQPENALASNNLARVMLQQGDNVDVALAMAQTARRGMPDSPASADTLGWAYYQKGAYNTAIDLFKEALKKNPDDATFHYHLGLAYQKDNQPALAKQHLERVLKINPKYTNAEDVRKALGQLI